MTEVIQSDRRIAFSEDVRKRTGIDEMMIRTLVHRFYERVRVDDVLAPIFASRIKDWEPHLERMCAFWSSVTLMTGRYHGRPMQLHAVLPATASHFGRWLSFCRYGKVDVSAAGCGALH
jgi:hemoglobin